MTDISLHRHSSGPADRRSHPVQQNLKTPHRTHLSLHLHNNQFSSLTEQWQCMQYFSRIVLLDLCSSPICVFLGGVRWPCCCCVRRYSKAQSDGWRERHQGTGTGDYLVSGHWHPGSSGDIYIDNRPGWSWSLNTTWGLGCR